MSEANLGDIFLELFIGEGYQKFRTINNGDEPWFYPKLYHVLLRAMIDVTKKERLEIRNEAMFEMVERLMQMSFVSEQEFKAAFAQALAYEIREKGGFYKWDYYFSALSDKMIARAGQLVLADQELMHLQTNYTVRRTQQLMAAVESAQKPSQIHTTNETYGVILQQLFCDCQEISFTDEENEQKVWKQIISSFTKGRQIDATLSEMLRSEFFEHCAYEADVPIFLKYFLAKLKLKRGEKKEAFRLLSELYGVMGQMDTSMKKRVQVLVDSKFLAENIEEFRQGHLWTEIWTKADRIEGLHSVNMQYKAYEIASFYGRCLTNFAEHYFDMHTWDFVELRKIMREHNYIANTYHFTNQKIVNVSLEWFFLLEETSLLKKHAAGDLLVHCQSGFQYSKQQKNNLFYLQCMLALSIYYLERQDDSRAYSLAVLAGKLMQRLMVSPSHEGVKQLLLFLKNRNNDLYAATIRYSKKTAGIPNAYCGEVWSEMSGCLRKGNLFTYDITERIQTM